MTCHEADPPVELHTLLTGLGVRCVAVTSSLTPARPANHVKTDGCDALRLAQLLRAVELTPLWVPRDEEQALRGLVRAREGAMADLRRARQELTSFLPCHGVPAPKGTCR